MLLQPDLVLLLVSQEAHIIVEHFLQEVSVKKQHSHVIAVNAERALHDLAELVLGTLDVDQQTMQLRDRAILVDQLLPVLQVKVDQFH